jgi:hypothetical protein
VLLPAMVAMMFFLAALAVTATAAPTDLTIEGLNEDAAFTSEPKPRFGCVHHPLPSHQLLLNRAPPQNKTMLTLSFAANCLPPVRARRGGVMPAGVEEGMVQQ